MLRSFPPMGVYETLFAFAAATGKTMGEPGTHPWAQGFPLTTRLPGGPPLPAAVAFGAADLRYPKADGQPELREAIARYYRDFHGARVTAENIAVFAGGRPAIMAILSFLLPGTTVAVEETEYTPYWDALRLLGIPTRLVASDVANRFRPTGADHDVAPLPGTSRVFLLKSNPCNPTGVAVTGDALRDLVRRFTAAGRGALFDEAYEFFLEPEPESALRHVEDIDATDVFVVGAATKGLQAPGLRVGWCVAARRHVELFRNWSSIGMGGVSRLSQACVAEMLEPARVRVAREAVARYFGAQRRRYADGLAALGLELFTGEGGFYHWCRLPEGLTGDALNERLFADDAAILPGRLCDMRREPGGGASRLDRMFRFSFGPLGPESFEDDLAILRRALGSGRAGR